MASVLPPPPPTAVPGPRADELLVDEQIRRTRRSLKFVDLFSGLLTLVIGLLLFLLFASVMEHWVIPGGWTSTGRTLLFVVMLAGIAWYCWRAFWPLVSRTINPAYAAQLIEQNTPSLKNSVLNFLLLRTRRQQLSQKVYEAIEHQAAQGLSHASVDAAVDRSVLLKLGYLLLAVVAICAAYRVLSPKNLTASMERVLLPWSNIAVPSRVEIVSVTPGNTEVARGESLEVSAEVLGLREDEPVRVRYSTLDNQAVDREVTLTGSEGTARFQGRLPDRFSAGDRSGSDGGGIQQDLEYWIEAGDAKSAKYRVTVFSRPTLVVEKIRYQFPRYTGLPPREVEGTGDVSALEGTQVSIYALANHDIASANIDFNADGRHDLPMSADKMRATGQFALELDEDRRTPKFDSYVLQYKTTNGRSSSLPPKYNIDVAPDYAPEVKIVAPVDEEGKLVEQLDVPLDTPFTVEVEARDPDFALQQVVILGEVGGEEVLKHDLLTKEHSGKFLGRMTATPQELNLKVGDVMEYSVAAVDNREPEPNITRTDKLRIQVVGPPQFGQQPQGQQPQQADGQQGGEGSEGGQGEEGMQGPGEAGNSGEGQQQQGQGQAGGEGEHQQGQGDAAGEQQGQGGESGAQGEQQESGQSPSADGGQQSGEQPKQPGQPGENQTGGQQQGQPQSGAPGQGGEQQPQEGGEQGQVASDGSDDGSAFDKMSQHFAEQDADSKGQGQASDAGQDTKQTESQNGNESRQGDGQGSPEEQKPSAEGGQNQEQGIDGAQNGLDSEGSGADGQPNEQREQQQSDGKPGEEGEKQEAPGGKMSTEQGEPGAGNNPGEKEGSMDTDAGRKSRDKTDKGPESKMNDQEAPGQSNSQQENDSKGGQGGDRSGGGQEGAGQQADAEGTGAAGENTAADDGGGQASEQGAGENSSQAGKQGTSEKPTGESGESKPGEGSKQSDQAGSKAGGEQSGQAGGEQQEAGEADKNDPRANREQNPESSSGNSESESAQDSNQTGSPTGQPGAEPAGGETGGDAGSPPPPGELEPGDAANLDYAKKQTDLVLDRLEDQLEKQDVDKGLLEKLGWTEDELRRFVDRWKSLKAEAEAAPSEETKQQLDNALRSLGLNPNRRTGYQSNVTKEKLRQLQQSYRGQIPLEYADQVRAYIKGTATVPDEKAE